MKKKAKVSEPTPDENVVRAITLAKALKSIDDAYYAMDAVFYNPRNYLELHDEIRDKIVELLVGVE